MTASSTRQLPSAWLRLAQRQRLGVSGGVVAELALVVTGADHLTVPDDHRTDRDVVVVERALGLAQRQPHVVLVAGEEVSAHRAEVSRSWQNITKLSHWFAVLLGALAGHARNQCLANVRC